MGVLDTLKFVDVQRKKAMTPDARMRDKVISALVTQKEIARAEREGRSYTVNVRTHATTPEGQRVQVERQKQPRKWFWKDAGGTLFLQLSYCNAPVVLANGQKVVEVGSVDNLDSVIDTLVEAVKAGELDAALKANQKPKAKKRTTPKKADIKA